MHECTNLVITTKGAKLYISYEKYQFCNFSMLIKYFLFPLIIDLSFLLYDYFSTEKVAENGLACYNYFWINAVKINIWIGKFVRV